MFINYFSRKTICEIDILFTLGRKYFYLLKLFPFYSDKLISNQITKNKSYRESKISLSIFCQSRSTANIGQHFMSLDEAFYDYVHILMLYVINSLICKYCLILGCMHVLILFYTLINILLHYLID